MAQKSSSWRRVVAGATTDRIELLLKILLLHAQASCLKLFGNMAPKGKAKARATARARAKARAVQVTTSNGRRDRRRDAARSLNALGQELGVGRAAVEAKSAPAAEVERLVRLLERRVCTDDHLDRLRAAAKAFADNGGELSAEVITEDKSSGPFAPQHRVLAAFFKLKSKAFMLTYNSRDFTKDTWVPFRAFVVDVVRTCGARAWAACLEQSLHSATADMHHLHAYLLWSDGVGIETRSLDPFYFQGVRPRVDVCSTRSATTSPQSAALHGLRCVAFPMDGAIEAETNYPAGQMYKPRAVWLQGLFESGKLKRDDYLKASASWFPVGHAARKRDTEEALRDRKSACVRKLVQDELCALEAAGARAQPRSFVKADEFATWFGGDSLWRRPILAILGATGLGKSMLAAAILLRIADKLRMPSPAFLEVTVEQDGHLDVADFDVERHSGILLDGLGDAAVLLQHRESLQGRPKLLKGARSATMKHAYEFTLTHRAVVATLDLSAANIDLFASDHWLSDPRNVALLRLDTPAWQGASTPHLPPMAPLAADAMHAWRVAGVVAFLERQDLHGPAALLYANGLDGHDLANTTMEELTTELRLSRFAAGKVLRARDAYFALR